MGYQNQSGIDPETFGTGKKNPNGTQANNPFSMHTDPNGVNTGAGNTQKGTGYNANSFNPNNGMNGNPGNTTNFQPGPEKGIPTRVPTNDKTARSYLISSFVIGGLLVYLSFSMLSFNSFGSGKITSRSFFFGFMSIAGIRNSIALLNTKYRVPAIIALVLNAVGLIMLGCVVVSGFLRAFA